MHPYLNTAIKAARSAASIILRHSERIDTLHVQQKTKNDYVTEVDRMAEDSIIRIINKAYPHHAILAEEQDQRHLPQTDQTWIIDPLDGTTNYIHNIPHYAISIAFIDKGKLEHGVILDPVKDELFSASRGAGATLNNRRIRTSGRLSLDGALLATGIPFREDQNIEAFLNAVRDFYGPISGIRRAGSAALDLAYVAAGRFDAYWESDLKPWDIAAGALIVEESGGFVHDFHGTSDYLNTGNIIAATPKLQKHMLHVISKYY